MFLIDSTNKLRGNRFMRRMYKPVGLDRNIVFFVKKNGIKKNLYHKTQTNKFAHMGLLQYNIQPLKWYFFCSDFFSLKHRFGAVFKNATGAYFSSPLIEALQLGSKVS